MSIALIRWFGQYWRPQPSSLNIFAPTTDNTMTMTPGDIVVIVTSFERPNNLARALLSLQVQSSTDHLAEIVVADDGSRDETWRVVERFSRQSKLPVSFTTHVHGGFQPGRSRNEAVLCSSAPYLAFVDGDCVLHPNFLATHVAHRRNSVALCGESLRLNRIESEAVTDDEIRRGDLMWRVGRIELRRYASKWRRDRLYSLLRVPMRPRLTGNHFSMWRTDFERVNGFDIGFKGWGLEDRDLQRRLRQIGVRCRSVLPHTVGFHLWHPVVSTFVRNARNTPNEARYRQPVRSDGRAPVGLSNLSRDAISISRWRGGKLVEHSPGKHPVTLAATA
jgi:glycosyltransferase involved in cell wall biosynthesis